MYTNFEPIGEVIKTVARKTPSGTAYKRGIAFGEHATDPNAAILATGTNFAGFVTRDTVLSPRDLREFLHPDHLLETPTIAGEMATLKDYNEIEAEGADHLVLDGTGAINSSAVVGTKLSFNAGRLRVAQEGENYYFIITANSAVASSQFANRNGALRIRARRADGLIPTP